MRIFLCLAVVFYGLSAFSQSYFISFRGSGAASDVNSVLVENLSKGTSLEIPGRDILWLTYPTGISTGTKVPSYIKIYPNPMFESSHLELYAPVSGDAEIRITNISGVTVIHSVMYLENIQHSFVISGLKSGLYVVSIKGSNYQYFERLICNHSSQGIPSIHKIVENRIEYARKPELRKAPEWYSDTTVMDYAMGDRIRFTAKSGNYKTVFIDVPESDKAIDFEFVPCSDVDGNHYSVVKINNNYWMAENLRTTRYNNGTGIEYLKDNSIWENIDTSYTGYYCFYDDDSAKLRRYGNLYNWVSAGFEWEKKLCPDEWHILKRNEFFDAIKVFDPSVIFLEEVLSAGGKFKETGTIFWQSPNAGASNESGFGGLPGGIRDESFYGLGRLGSWWLGYGEGFQLDYDKTSIYYWWDRYNGGHSVRCVRDQVHTSPVESVTANSAKCGGKILNDNGSHVVERGVCWSTSEPTVAGLHTSDGSGLGSFTSTITGLSPGTSYLVRAYAINQRDTLYGNTVAFRTLP